MPERIKDIGCLEIYLTRHDGRAPVSAFAALGALLQLVKRHALAAQILHHQDRIRLDNAVTAAAGDPEIIATPCALIDRIQFVSNHGARWNIGRTFVNIWKAPFFLPFHWGEGHHGAEAVGLSMQCDPVWFCPNIRPIASPLWDEAESGQNKTQRQQPADYPCFPPKPRSFPSGVFLPVPPTHLCRRQ